MQHTFRKILKTVLILVVLGIITLLIMPKRSGMNANVLGQNPAVTPQVTITGKIACLPHRDTSGPTTLECAYGLETDDGSYYALDTSAYSSNAPGFDTGTRVNVTGTVDTEHSVASAQTWGIYNIVGIIEVMNITVP